MLTLTVQDVLDRAPTGTVLPSDEGRAAALLADALAEARRVAPILATTGDPDVLRVAGGVVCWAVLVRMGLSPGKTSEQYGGEYSYEQERTGGGMFSPDQLDQLRGLAPVIPEAGVYELAHASAHRPIGDPR
ncbi:hypothetical protein KCV87_32195 [Actinosynnema pretiosum subsp. pretiosum]|uniref:Uncharacterized protein n=1 Tax=Actinosynnema pretiosum subsp. pretiosum TaxID=103721 RepID=A0AA45R3P2_9PSEU|nr:hypothetical protein APASM_4699 [Actinosynnema pretiosum subsp. pretiosum]QUF03964.1 hypothetical protein KCV87_32195 [Actinosynnema pretiosum subsp. pretiosum]